MYRVYALDYYVYMYSNNIQNIYRITQVQTWTHSYNIIYKCTKVKLISTYELQD